MWSANEPPEPVSAALKNDVRAWQVLIRVASLDMMVMMMVVMMVEVAAVMGLAICWLGLLLCRKDIVAFTLIVTLIARALYPTDIPVDSIGIVAVDVEWAVGVDAHMVAMLVDSVGISAV